MKLFCRYQSLGLLGSKAALLLGFLLVSGCIGNPVRNVIFSDHVPDSNWQTFSNEFFSMRIPKGYRVKGADHTLYSAKESMSRLPEEWWDYEVRDSNGNTVFYVCVVLGGNKDGFLGYRCMSSKSFAFAELDGYKIWSSKYCRTEDDSSISRVFNVAREGYYTLLAGGCYDTRLIDEQKMDYIIESVRPKRIATEESKPKGHAPRP